MQHSAVMRLSHPRWPAQNGRHMWPPCAMAPYWKWRSDGKSRGIRSLLMVGHRWAGFGAQTRSSSCPAWSASSRATRSASVAPGRFARLGRSMVECPGGCGSLGGVQCDCDSVFVAGYADVLVAFADTALPRQPSDTVQLGVVANFGSLGNKKHTRPTRTANKTPNQPSAPLPAACVTLLSFDAPALGLGRLRITLFPAPRLAAFLQSTSPHPLRVATGPRIGQGIKQRSAHSPATAFALHVMHGGLRRRMPVPFLLTLVLWRGDGAPGHNKSRE